MAASPVASTSTAPLRIVLTREVTVHVQMQELEREQEQQQCATTFNMPCTPTTAHCRDSTLPTPPPAYEHAFVSAATPDTPAEALGDKLPDYSSFTETTRAERCFWYGFLFFPAWLWGFLHFWAYWSSVPSFASEQPSELPQWHVSPISSSTSGPALPSSPPQKRSSWRSIFQSSGQQSRPTETTLTMNRPEVRSDWRKEERLWALRCGYALAALWSIVLTFLFVAIRVGFMASS